MKTMMMMTWISLGIEILNQRGNFMGAEGGSDAGGGDAGGGTEGGGDAGGGDVSWQYPEGFDETLKGNPTLLKYADKEKGTFDYGKIMKAHVHATSMIGKDKVTLPDETWTEDQWGDLYQKLGKPADLDSYKVEGAVPEGMEENKEFASKFKEAAFHANLLPKQAEKIYNAINEHIHGTITELDGQDKAQYDSEVSGLKKEWGEAFEQKCVRAYSALEQFASKDEIERLKSEGFIQSPLVTKLFDKVASSLSEDKFDLEGAKTFGMTPQEAEDKISSMYKADHPFMIRNHPQQRHYQEEMQKLQRIKLAGKNSK